MFETSGQKLVQSIQLWKYPKFQNLQVSNISDLEEKKGKKLEIIIQESLLLQSNITLNKLTNIFNMRVKKQ